MLIAFVEADMRNPMTRFALVALFVAAAACTRRTPEQQLVHDAAEALGGQARIDAVSVLTMEGTGTQYNLGQDLRPGLADQTFTVSAFKREIEAGVARMRTTQTRTPNFAYFQGPQAQTQTQGLDQDVAYNVGASGTPARAAAAAEADRRAEQLHHPLRLLRFALGPNTVLSAVRTEGAERLVDITTYAGPITLAVGADNRPTRIQSHGTHINLGDVTLSTTFADYADAGGLQLPTRITTKVDDFTTGTYQVKNSTAAAGSLEAPPEARSAAVPAAPAVNVAVEEVAPGVWFLAGQSHHSAVVAFKDRLVLIEAPQSEARSLAVIARAKELRPGTPLTHLVMSHHHFDHSTGLRAAIAEGLTVVTQAGNEAFVKEMAARPFTRTPDTLAKAPKPPVVVAVGDTHTITDGARELLLYHVAGNPHSDTMLMAYLPRERLLIEVDAFSPGGSYHPYAANLLEHVQKRKLRVDRIIPLHGTIQPFSALGEAAKPPA
jgi:glyoxylase-like metal-dependent hydrolase (beta-lactamase superfamily II)